jgi:hypothetical protein
MSNKLEKFTRPSIGSFSESMLAWGNVALMRLRAILIEHGFRLENRKCTYGKRDLYSFVRSKMALFSFAQKGAIYFRVGLENRFSIFEPKPVLDKNGPKERKGKNV